ncbi:MAG: hypothetical protein GWN01_03445 [Nitrosopumilaceae archaeon]|nr:hypothetical protein [Nitrosopumilaceae archaeon]NIU86389.1 hypothetical protein [Nitrosopumilaceae archaeon]NIV67119.1 hypothetical protein [Nitrosopumilaceae archaeon]NIX60617.1 hypothetical protein [Nitrosopumilaceae archaeon]
MTQKRNVSEMFAIYSMWEEYLPVKIYPIDQFIDKLIRDEEWNGFLNIPVNFHIEDNCGIVGCLCSAGWDVDENGNVTKCSGQKEILTNVNDNITKLPIWGICNDVSECPCDSEFEKKNIRSIDRK